MLHVNSVLSALKRAGHWQHALGCFHRLPGVLRTIFFGRMDRMVLDSQGFVGMEYPGQVHMLLGKLLGVSTCVRALLSPKLANG